MESINQTKQDPIDVAVIGATGLVGQTMLKVLEELDFPVRTLLPVGSKRSVGKEVMFQGKPHRVISVTDALRSAPHVALFSAGGSVSLEWAPQFAAQGCTVVDNSSAFRMDESCPLVVPEVNGSDIKSHHRIIANP
ncbi:MAG: aspartate-semialdehyde dehydrogenase, partial [Flavobacteriales bacterium]|nr:aspartate-semialdehyde dehydrogenase [Flavobacteriales bacterium]